MLAERGLGDAVRALALRLPLDTQVTVDVEGGRADAPVESAAYFAVSEVLTNAVKHSGAERVRVDLRYADGSLRIAVTDNGRGGARIGGALRARRARPGLPVLVLSQHVERLYARELLADGVGGVGYLLKDRVFDAEQFVDAVRRVAAGGTAMDPQVIQQLLVGRAGDGRPWGG